MNIGRLINPMGLHLRRKTSLEETEQTEDKHQPIVAPNQMKNHQRSYFKQSEQFERDTSCQMSEKDEEERKMSRLDMIQSQLQDIDKMKKEFQKRKKIESQNSMDKVGNRSIDRHHLKPSAIPKIPANTSQFSVSPPEYQVPAQISKQDPQTMKMQGYRGEVILLDHDSLFELQSQQKDHKQHREGFKDQESGCSTGHCNCQLHLNAFMQEARQIFTEVQRKIELMQRSNASYRKQISQYNQQNDRILNRISKLEKEKKEALDQHKVEFNKNVQLNQILNETSCKNYQFSVIDTSKRNKQNLQAQSLKKKPINSKVQSLLQRLQLRIQKSS